MEEPIKVYNIGCKYPPLIVQVAVIVSGMSAKEKAIVMKPLAEHGETEIANWDFAIELRIKGRIKPTNVKIASLFNLYSNFQVLVQVVVKQPIKLLSNCLATEWYC